MSTDRIEQVAVPGEAAIDAGQTPAADSITCHNCEREVPGGSAHCPHCCGDDGRRGAARRGAFFGGILGLLGGAVGAAMWSSIFAPEHNTWGVVSGIMAVCAVAGAVLGIRANHNE